MDVLCFGEPLVGFYPPPGFSMADDIPIIKTWGGDTSNVALGVSRLGRKASYLTRVGKDPFGDGFLSLWVTNGVDTSLVEVDDTRNTGLYFVSFEGVKHHLTYYRKQSAASAIKPECIDRDMISPFKLIHLSGISIGMSSSAFQTGKALVNTASELNKRVSFDINYRPAQWNSPEEAGQCMKEVIHLGVDILEITDDEMMALGWGDDPNELRKIFPQVKIAVYKQGAEGATIITSEASFSVKACSVQVRDTVGAGDSFVAGFIVALLNGVNLKNAAEFATLTAAHTCTGTGPLEKMPSREDVLRLAEETGTILETTKN